MDGRSLYYLTLTTEDNASTTLFWLSQAIFWRGYRLVFPEAASTKPTSKFQNFMHNSITVNGGTVVNEPLKEYCRQKVVLFILFAIVSRRLC